MHSTTFLLLQILATILVNGFSVVNRTLVVDSKHVKSVEALQDVRVDRGSNSKNFSSHINSNQDFSNFVKHHTAKKSPSLGMHVPQYMVDLYKHLSNKRWSPKFDTARSYGVVNTRVPEYINEFWNDHKSLDGYAFEIRTINFNISHFPPNELVLMAQLRFYVLPAGNLQLWAGDSASLVIYSLKDNDKEILFERSLEPQGDYWETFDITDVFLKWIITHNESESQSLDVGIRKKTGSIMNVILETSSENEPQILVLSRTNSENKPPKETVDSLFQRPAIDEEPGRGNRHRRETPEQKTSLEFGHQKQPEKSNTLSSIRHMIVKRSEEEDEENEELSNYIVEEVGKQRKNKPKKRKNPCRRRSMRVTFTDIGYDQWIIAPPSYEAFECTGKCSFPMGSHLSPTKHAVIQTLMHSLKPKQIPRACCVPTKLEPISVLYIDDDGTVTYKYEYDEMIVTECGCR